MIRIRVRVRVMLLSCSRLAEIDNACISSSASRPSPVICKPLYVFGEDIFLCKTCIREISIIN